MQRLAYVGAIFRVFAVLIAGNAISWWAEIRILTVLDPFVEKTGLYEISHLDTYLFMFNFVAVYSVYRIVHVLNHPESSPSYSPTRAVPITALALTALTILFYQVVT